MSELLIPKTFKFMGKDQQTLYKEAMSKKAGATPPTPPKFTTPNSIRKVICLVGDGGKTEFSAMKALAEAQSKGKTLASLKDADAYARTRFCDVYTGELIIYPAPDEKFGSTINYTDAFGVSYRCDIPFYLSNETGKSAIIVMNGYLNNDANEPYFRLKKDKSGVWEVQFHQTIQNGPQLLNPTLKPLKIIPIHRKNGYYLPDSDMFPNGAPCSMGAKNALLFSQIDNGPFIGFIRRLNAGNHLVYAAVGPSPKFPALVYE